MLVSIRKPVVNQEELSPSPPPPRTSAHVFTFNPASLGLGGRFPVRSERGPGLVTVRTVVSRERWAFVARTEAEWGPVSSPPPLLLPSTPHPPQDFSVHDSQVWTPALPATPSPHPSATHGPPNPEAKPPEPLEVPMAPWLVAGLGDRSLRPGLRGPYTANRHPPLGLGTPPRLGLSRSASPPKPGPPQPGPPPPRSP